MTHLCHALSYMSLNADCVYTRISTNCGPSLEPLLDPFWTLLWKKFKLYNDKVYLISEVKDKVMNEQNIHSTVWSNKFHGKKDKRVKVWHATKSDIIFLLTLTADQFYTTLKTGYRWRGPGFVLKTPFIFMWQHIYHSASIFFFQRLE